MIGLLSNCNITTYLTGSALIPLGLTWWQAFIGRYFAILLPLMLTTCSYYNWKSSRNYCRRIEFPPRSALLEYAPVTSSNSALMMLLLTRRIQVGFPVFNRVVWGMWGSQFTIWNRIFLSFGESQHRCMSSVPAAANRIASLVSPRQPHVLLLCSLFPNHPEGTVSQPGSEGNAFMSCFSPWIPSSTSICATHCRLVLR